MVSVGFIVERVMNLKSEEESWNTTSWYSGWVSFFISRGRFNRLNPADFAEGTAKVQLSSEIPNPRAKLFGARRVNPTPREACCPCKKVVHLNPALFRGWLVARAKICTRSPCAPPRGAPGVAARTEQRSGGVCGYAHAFYSRLFGHGGEGRMGSEQ